MKQRLWLTPLFLLLWISSALIAFAQNPAIVPTPASPSIQAFWADRWQQKLARVKRGNIDLILVGDSITHFWDNPENQSLWSAYYEPRKAVNLGFGGARTENILLMLDRGLVDGIAPKVAVVMIGTNNTDYKNFPHADTAEQIAEGITRIVQTLRTKLPKTKILLLRIFPRDYLPGTREVGSQASALAAKIADGKMIFYLDINKVFLKPDGAVDSALMPDLLHPNQRGYLLWAEAMEPMLTRLMGKPANSAAIPAPKCEQDFYDWNARHDAVKTLIHQQPVDLVFIGDSITHLFGGPPIAERAVGANVWDHYYESRHAVNLGFGWDRTQQVLWRLNNGEFAGVHPKVAVVLVGTNNLTPHAVRGNTNAEIVAGITAVCASIHQKSPKTKILLLGLFPRGQQPTELDRLRIIQINQALAGLQGKNNVTFLDIGETFLGLGGVGSADVMPDFLHPSEKGYGMWAAAMEPTLARLLGDKPAAMEPH
jgi:lysophospholipase L1-like esterase